LSYLQDLKAVISINSHTYNKNGVDKVGDKIAKWFTKLGFSHKVFTRELIGHHHLFSSPKTEGKKLLLLGHIDTVFPKGTFESYSEDEHWVYGPGVCDMKGGIVVAHEALKSLPKIENIDILLVSDEETGSDDSKHLTSKLATNYDYCFVFEAAGEIGEVVSGRKGVGTFNIHIQGKAAHAGNHYIKGHDANLEAAIKLQKLVALTNLDKGTTLNVGKIDGGIGANTISPKSSLLFEIRYTQIDEKERLLNAIDEIVSTSYVNGTISTLSGGIQRDVMEESEDTLNFIKSLENISNTSIPYERRGGVSDANIVSSAGVLTLDGFGPFGDGDHTVDERASKQSFKERIELTSKLLHHFIINKSF